jgi:regulator of replication initiation timing
MNLLVSLNERIEMLIRKYSALQAENARLREQLSIQSAETARLNEALAVMQEKMLAMQIGQGVTDEQEKEKLKGQLDKLIAEIDHLLITLND